ncbi:MAG: DNA primase [Pseudomonadota bacterium]|nr:DNA primase [Pseudomonadota bacterium]
MAVKIPQDFIDEVIGRSSLVDFISKYIQLRKFGANYKACCPFHNEKTPSFSVSSSKQLYHCFGCGASGNIITFAMKYNNIDFVAAVEMIARDTGLQMPQLTQIDPKVQQKYNAARSIYEQVYKTYQGNLKNNEASMKYLVNRGICKDNIEKYKLGYSLNSWDDIKSRYENDCDILIQVGLIIKNNNKTYDRFRDRIMFPILNEKGYCIGFGGRTLTDQTPKYLNSSDSFLFKKGKELYGLYQIIQTKKSPNSIIVVEGYMDVIALASNKVNNAVASLGTAITKEQIQKILKYSQKIIFCFDGDKAGKAAAWKALKNIMPLMHKGIFVKFVFLPDGEDPDSYIRKHGKQGLADFFKNSKSLTDYFFTEMKTLHGGNDISSKAKFADECSTIINSIPKSVFRSLLEDKLNSIIGLNIANKKPVTSENKRPIQKQSHKYNDNQRLLSLILQQPKILQDIQKTTADINHYFNNNKFVVDILSYIIASDFKTTSAQIYEKFKKDEELFNINPYLQYDHIIPEDGYLIEALEIITNINKSEVKTKIYELLDKSKKSELSPEEKIELKHLLQQQTKA